MKFELYRSGPAVVGSLGESPWRWRLTAKEGPVACSPREYDTEDEARKAIAGARKTMGGVRFAKVVVT